MISRHNGISCIFSWFLFTFVMQKVRPCAQTYTPSVFWNYLASHVSHKLVQFWHDEIRLFKFNSRKIYHLHFFKMHLTCLIWLIQLAWKAVTFHKFLPAQYHVNLFCTHINFVKKSSKQPLIHHRRLQKVCCHLFPLLNSDWMYLLKRKQSQNTFQQD